MESFDSLYHWVADPLCAQEINIFNGSLRLILSMLLGAAVGWERKQKGQAAGMRTFALISMGACLAMLLSIYVPQVYLGLKNGDPGRIAAQVVTGVGFLGGGAMIQQKGSVRGLTTAAGIWVVAVLGMAVGVGMYAGAVISTLLILFTLTWLEKWEHKHRVGHETKVISVKVNKILTSVDDYKHLLGQHNVGVTTFYMECNYEQQQTDINFVVLLRKNVDFPKLFELIRTVNPTRSITLSTQIEI